MKFVKRAKSIRPIFSPRPATFASLSATPPPKVGKGEKDIFEDTDFEVDALGSDESDDRTMQIEATSDFDLDESDSASEVFAIDEEDVDESAATAMGPAQLDEEDSGEFGADEDSGAGKFVVTIAATAAARSRSRSRAALVVTIWPSAQDRAGKSGAASASLAFQCLGWFSW